MTPENDTVFRAIADTAPVLIWMSGPDKLCYFFNRPWLNFTGRTMEQEQGNGWAEGVHLDDFDRCLETYVTSFDARQPFEMEYRLRRFDGEYRWVLDNGVPHYQPDGTFAGYIGSCIDITDRKRAEESSRTSEERMRRLSDAAFEGIVITQHDRIADANAAYATLYRVPLEQMLGTEYLHWIAPQWRESVQRNNREEIQEPFEVFCQRPDGTTFWAEMQQRTTTHNGERARVTGIRDITAHKQAVEQLHLFEKVIVNMSDALLITEAHPMDPSVPSILYANPAFERMTGYSSAELQGKTPRILQGPKTDKHELHRMRAAMTQREPIQAELTNYRKDGTEYQVEFEVVPVLDEAGHVTHFVSVQRDVTARRQAEEQRRANTQRLEILAEASRAFAEVTTDMDALLNLIAKTLADALGDVGCIRLLSEDGQLFTSTVVEDSDPEVSVFIKSLLDAASPYADDYLLSRRIMEAGQPLLLPVVDQDTVRPMLKSNFWPLLDRIHIRSAIITPMRFQGRATGLLFMGRHRSESSAYNEDDLHLVQDLADRAALAISNARLFQRVQDELAERKRAAEERVHIMDTARCLLWQAKVSEVGGSLLDWDMQYPADEVAQRFLPIALEPDQDYEEGFYLARIEEDRIRSDQEGTAKIRAGQSYEQEFRTRAADGSIRWLHEFLRVETLEARQKWHVVGVCVDITERKKAEVALRESENRFRQLVESLPQLVWTCTPDGACDYLSPQWVAYTGVPAQGQLGFGWLERLHPEDREPTILRWQATVAMDSEFCTEFRIRRFDGRYRWFDTRAVPLRDAEGRIVKWFGTNTDIHEARETREALRLEQERLANLASAAPGALHSIRQSPEGTITFPYASPGIEKIYGLSPESLAVDGGIIAERIHPDDRKRLTITMAESARTLTPWRDEWRVQVPGRDEIWVEGHSRPVLEADGSLLWHGFLTDITDRKRAEESLHRLMESARCLLWSAEVFRQNPESSAPNNLGWRYLYFDEEVAQRFNPLEILPDMTYVAASYFWRHPEDRARIDMDAAAKIQAGEDYTEEYRVRSAHGEWLWMREEVRVQEIAPWRWRIVSVVVNITEMKRAEEALRELNTTLERRVAERTAALETANKELEAFAYSVSHDLRAPLRGIDGFSQALLEDYDSVLDETGRDYLSRVREGSQRMAELIEDLLSLSRVTSGVMRRETVNLSALAQQASNSLSRSDAERARQVEFIIASDLQANGDGRLLRLVLDNLLGNAWKYTSKHEQARIEFGVREQDSERIFFVRDDGAGFDMTYAGKLFGVFQRLHSSRDFEGTGIGLATVQRIIHRHGGRIWAEAAPEQGATFFFTLPNTPDIPFL